MSDTISIKEHHRIFTTKELILIAMFTAITAVCAWISIPFGPIVFTLQTFAIFCTVCISGGKNGFFSILTYILLGAVGLPVFSHFSGGISALLSNTGGYIIGFIFIPLVYMTGEKFLGRKLPLRIVYLLLGLFICYAFGTAWFMFIYCRNVESITLSQALKWCVTPFVPFDLAKMAFALIISERVKKYVRL